LGGRPLQAQRTLLGPARGATSSEGSRCNGRSRDHPALWQVKCCKPFAVDVCEFREPLLPCKRLLVHLESGACFARLGALTLLSAGFRATQKRSELKPISKDALEDEHPPTGDQMRQVIGQLLDPFLGLLLPVLDVDDLSDQHVIG
jgi:hypothetical protein